MAEQTNTNPLSIALFRQFTVCRFCRLFGGMKMSIEKINAAREQIASTSAYKTLTAFFDEGSFTEIDAFVKSGDGFAEVTAGFGTVEGLPVVEELIAQGVNVNVTLLFSVKRYGEVIEAWMRGLERRVANNLPLEGIGSVASFFVSRVDTEADKRLDKAYAADPSLKEKYGDLRGKLAVANACLAYELFLQKTGTERWQKLAALGASVQRPLWASTSTKNPAYKDTLYVDDLIGPNCVNTMPDNTVVAFSDHGTVKETLTPEAIAESHKLLEAFAKSGQDMVDVTDNVLMTEGVDKFAVAYTQLLEAVTAKLAKLTGK